MNLSQRQPAPKQLNLNKLSDAGGPQIHRLSDDDKTEVFSWDSYNSMDGFVNFNPLLVQKALVRTHELVC
jgi:hypothetical protein